MQTKYIAAKKQMQVQGFSAFAGLALQDPDANKRFIQKKLAKLNGLLWIICRWPKILPLTIGR